MSLIIDLYKPELNDLWFRQKLLSDPDTMSYNKKWGGTIDFPRERWDDWYRRWVVNSENKRFYRYLVCESAFVGEAAYHYDDVRAVFLCDIIVFGEYRGKGYGTVGLWLLCEAARENGVAALYDDIADDNPAVKLFLDNGFAVEQRTEDVVTVKKLLGGNLNGKQLL